MPSGAVVGGLGFGDLDHLSAAAVSIRLRNRRERFFDSSFIFASSFGYFFVGFIFV